MNIAWWDFFWISDILGNIDRYLYMRINQTWQGAFNTIISSWPWFFFLSLFQHIWIRDNNLVYIHILFILIFSFISFYICAWLFFNESQRFSKIVWSIAYIFNNLVGIIFSFTWGYTHHFLFYIFLPILFWLTYKIYSDWNNRRFILYWIFLFLSIIWYNNFAFFILLSFLQFLLVVILIFLWHLKIKNIIIPSIVIFFMSVILLGSFFYPIIQNILESYNSIVNTQAFWWDANWWIVATSSNFINSFNLSLDKRNFSNFFGVIYIIIPLLIVLKGKIKKNILWALIILFLIFLLLSVRAYWPFYQFALWFYKLPLVNSFRSPDKIFIVLPLIYSLLVTGFLQKKNKIINFLILIMILVIPFKIYSWEIDKILSTPNENNFKYKVNIPQEYYNIQSILNSGLKNSSIISLPYHVNISLNWSEYPKRNFLWHDILYLLYKKRYISANTYDHPNLETKLSRKEINDNPYSTNNDLIKNINKFGWEYIIYHKDIAPYQSFLNKKIHNLVSDSKDLILLTWNDYFDLYKIKDKYIRSIIWLNDNFSLIYSKINPTKYYITIKWVTWSTSLSFLQSFHNERKLFPDNTNKLKSNCQNIQSYNSYTESWSYQTGKIYIVDPWDTIYSIARLYGIKSDYIYDINKLETAKLKAWQSLILKPEVYPEMIQTATGNITECTQSWYSFFEWEELSYLRQKPLRDINHKMIYDYANWRDISLTWSTWQAILQQWLSEGWITKNSDWTYDISLVLYFRPQSWFYLWLWISGFTFILLIIWLIFFRKNHIDK